MLATAFSLAIGLPCAYAIARFRMRRSGVVVLLVKLWRRFSRNMKALKEHDHYRFDVTPPPLSSTPPPLPGSRQQKPEPEADNSRYMPKDDQ